MECHKGFECRWDGEKNMEGNLIGWAFGELLFHRIHAWDEGILYLCDFCGKCVGKFTSPIGLQGWKPPEKRGEEYPPWNEQFAPENGGPLEKEIPIGNHHL